MGNLHPNTYFTFPTFSFVVTVNHFTMALISEYLNQVLALGSRQRRENKNTPLPLVPSFCVIYMFRIQYKISYLL